MHTALDLDHKQESTPAAVRDFSIEQNPQNDAAADIRKLTRLLKHLSVDIKIKQPHAIIPQTWVLKILASRYLQHHPLASDWQSTVETLAAHSLLSLDAFYDETSDRMALIKTSQLSKEALTSFLYRLQAYIALLNRDIS